MTVRLSFLGFVFSACCLLAMLACSTPAPSLPTTTPPGATATPQADDRVIEKAALERLEQEARALARTDGCSENGPCRAAPVGAKACGGPRYWIPYCSLTTDSAALLRKLEELRTAESAFNQKYLVLSDCSFVTAPTVSAVNGSCVAAAAPGTLR
jgi:hypothetical protein